MVGQQSLKLRTGVRFSQPELEILARGPLFIDNLAGSEMQLMLGVATEVSLYHREQFVPETRAPS